MKKLEDIKTIEDILEAEKEMIPLAEKQYGEAFKNASGFNNLLNNFLKEADPEAWLFLIFLSQIKKHHTLALFSACRLHHVQTMLNLRQVLEAGVNAAYGLANPNQEDFAKKENGILNTSKTLDNKRYKWIEKNHPNHSTFIKNMKKSINQSCAHSNISYAMQNFSMADYQFNLSFFDNAEEHHVKADFWMLGNIAMSLMDLFFGISKETKNITFINSFINELKQLEEKNHALKAELQSHPRFQRFATGT